MKPSKFVNPQLVDCVTEYDQKWYMRREEANLKQIKDRATMRQELINEARQRKQEEEKKVEDLRLAKVVESMNVL